MAGRDPGWGLRGPGTQPEDVRVLLQGTQTLPDGMAGDTVTEAEGTLRRLGDAWHILFAEAGEEGRGGTKTHIALREHSVEVHKRGDVEVDFLFREGEQTRAEYRTDCGGIPMGILTRKLQVRETGTGLMAELGYELSAGEGPGIDCRILIEADKIVNGKRKAT